MKSKIRIVLFVCSLFISGGLFIGSSSTSIAQGSGCPNGCMGPGDSCFCHTWHLDLKEYGGGKTNP